MAAARWAKAAPLTGLATLLQQHLQMAVTEDEAILDAAGGPLASDLVPAVGLALYGRERAA